jgi:DNA-binding transcriptional LysR family regulator
MMEATPAEHRSKSCGRWNWTASEGPGAAAMRVGSRASLLGRPLMDTDALESFVAVVEEGSVAGAARRLKLTAGAVAQRIRKLEQDLGTRLVIRAGRAVRPTDVGAAVLGRVRDVLRDADELRRTLAGHASGGTLRIGVVPSAVSGLVPGLMASLAARCPENEVTMVCSSSARLYPLVLDRELDAAILFRPSHHLPKTCKWAALYKARLVLLAPATDADSTPGALLESRPFIRYAEDDGARLGDLYLQRTGLRPSRVVAELDSLELIERLVAARLGVSLLPDWVGAPAPGTIRLPVPGAECSRQLGLLWARGSARIGLMCAVLERLIGILAEHREPAVTGGSAPAPAAARRATQTSATLRSAPRERTEPSVSDREHGVHTRRAGLAFR